MKQPADAFGADASGAPVRARLSGSRLQVAVRRAGGLVAACALIAGGSDVAQADADLARYNSIVERNPFGLKPPPPPPDPAASQPPPPPLQLATVELTGITSILSSKKACLEIIPGPGKQMLKPILSEGEKVESIEVVSIDIEKNQVVIKNGPITTNLTFKVAKASTTPLPPGGQPGLVPPVIPGTVPGAPPQAAFNYSQPTSGRSGVIMTGGTPAYEPPAAASAAGLNPAAAASGFRSIPSRNIRGGLPQLQQPQPNPGMSPEAAVIDMEEKKRAYPNLPFPPTLLSPRTPQLPPLPGQ